MIRRAQVGTSKLQSSLLHFARSGALSNSQLVTACLNSPAVGIAILDKQLRFEAFNDALASTLGMAANGPMGLTIRQTLGPGAVQLERQVRKVFSAGRTLPGFEITATAKKVRWSGTTFPICDALGAVVNVGVIMVRGRLPGLKEMASGTVDSALRPRTEPILAQVANIDSARLRSSLFRNLDDNSLELVLSAAQIVHRSRGEFFCQQGAQATHLYLFTSGRVKLSGTTQAGREVLIDWMKVGDVVGLGGLVPLPVQYCWTASALEESHALAWDRATISGLAVCWPSIYENGLQIALRWALQLQERLEEVSTEMVEQRLAHIILRLAPAHQTEKPAYLRISDEELSLMIGTNMFAVNRIINRWQKLGYVQKARKRLLILSHEGLSQVAQNEVPVNSIENVRLETGA